MAGRKHQRIRPAAVFDIETEGWDRFFCGALLTRDRLTSYRWERERDMVEAILRIGKGDVFAHNGGRFDFLWFLDALFRFDLFTEGMTIEAAESGASVITISIKGPGMDLRLRDSYRMFPVALSKMGAKGSVGVSCTMLSEACREQARLQAENGREAIGCGGYCAINRSLPLADVLRIVDYCAQDCRVLWDGLHRLIAFAEDDLALSLAGTTGATAWKTARAWELIEPTALQHRQWQWIRQGYFGGRVGLFRPEADRGWHYDITSSYPHQTSQPLPDGSPTLASSAAEARRRFGRAAPGIYRARVTIHEDTLIPPLPWRAIINGDRRNAYPVGSFTGEWALPELQYAEEIGMRVEPIQAMTFPGERDAFRPLMNHLIASRLRYGKETAEGALIKLWANSLYGKFAQEPRTHRLVLARSSFDVPEGSIPINEAATAFLVPYDGTPAIPECSHVEKAAYITARGRIQLHRMLTARGSEDAIYCDTDSVFSTVPRGALDGVREGLGGWADEGEFRQFAAIGPKLYRYDQKTRAGDWKPVLKAKGIALPRDLDALAATRAWKEIASGAVMRNDAGVASLRTTLRGGGPLFARKALARSTGGRVTYGDRMADGRGSRPPHARELIPFEQTYRWS